MDNMLYRFSIPNRQTLKPIHWLCSVVGCNTGSAIKTKDPRKFITLMLSLVSVVSLAAQINFIWQNRHKSILFYTDAICTSLQCIVSMTKLLQLAVLQSQFYNMLQIVQNSTVLRDLELFQLDLPNKNIMIADVKQILRESWNDIKMQLNFFFTVAFAICCWYFCSCTAINLYKTYLNPQEFDLIYPQFPKWHTKDTQFPYFLIEYTIVGTEWYLCSISGAFFSSTFVVLSVHGIALIKVLCKLIEYTTCDDYVPPRDRLNYIKSCIKLQQRVYQYCDDLNSIYKIESVPFFVTIIFIKCLIIFQASTAGSYRLQSVIYDCKWFNECAQFKFITQMMLMRSNRVVNLTVGGFTTMSLVTLLAIMRSSGSYFLLLKEVNDTNQLIY